jgi:DNA invertase Pin-like site-specific DNA recombinase
MAAVRKGKVDCIVCYKLDRIGRSLVHLALIIDELSRLNVPLICVSQGIDTSSDNPVGRLQLGVLMAVAEFERSLIRERTKAGLVAARARGAKIGRPDKTTPHREEILALKAAGASVRKIADQLGLAASSIQRILKSAVPQSSPAKNAA